MGYQQGRLAQKFKSSKHIPQQDLNVLLIETAEFHGHLGPFLSLGIRLSLVGLKRLGSERGDSRLYTKVTLNYEPPISCILDGIQKTTGCTVGNKRLSWKESKQIKTIFLRENGKRLVQVSVKPSVLDELRHKLSNKQLDDPRVRELALDIFSRPDNELFTVRHKQHRLPCTSR